VLPYVADMQSGWTRGGNRLHLSCEVANSGLGDCREFMICPVL